RFAGWRSVAPERSSTRAKMLTVTDFGVDEGRDVDGNGQHAISHCQSMVYSQLCVPLRDRPMAAGARSARIRLEYGKRLARDPGSCPVVQRERHRRLPGRIPTRIHLWCAERELR